MKKLLLLAAVLVLVYSSAALALDPMGPPAAGLTKGQFSAGVEWSYTDMDLNRQGGWGGHLWGPLDMRMHKVYANLGYGITDNWDLFARLGGAYMEFDSKPAEWKSNEWEGEDTGVPAAGAGAKYTFYEDTNLKFGGLAQFSWVTFDGSQKPTPSSGDYEKSNFVLELTEWQFAVGPTWAASDNFTLYGGPFWHLVDGWLSQGKNRGVIEKSVFGVYIGGQIDMSTNCFANIEWMYTEQSNGFAAGLIWTY